MEKVLELKRKTSDEPNEAKKVRCEDQEKLVSHTWKHDTYFVPNSIPIAQQQKVFCLTIGIYLHYLFNDIMTLDKQYEKEIFKDNADILRHFITHLENKESMGNLTSCLINIYCDILDLFNYFINDIKIKITKPIVSKTMIFMNHKILSQQEYIKYMYICDIVTKIKTDKTMALDTIIIIVHIIRMIIGDFINYRITKQKPTNYKKILCEDWTKNICKYKNCVYAHGEAELIKD